MVKRKTINLPEAVSIINGMEASGFRVGELVRFIFDEATGRASHDLPNAIAGNFERAVENWTQDPMRTGIDTGMAYGTTRILFKLLGYGASFFKIKKSVAVGNIRIKIVVK